MSVQPKTIQIFLPDGNARSIRIADITSRMVQAISIPRAKVKEAGARDEIKKVGVYFLFGASDDDSREQVYIGEAEDCYEELGSGVRRVNQYLPHYAPGAGKPVFDDGDMFTVTVPITAVTPEVTPEVMNMLVAIQGEMSRKDIQARLGLTDEKHFREYYQQPAVAQGLLEMTIPDKPNSRLQKYRLTAKGKEVLEKDE